MANLEPASPPAPPQWTRWESPRPIRTNRELARLGSQTVVRVAQIQAEGLVQNEKVHELDRLASTAMTGQAMLAKFRDTLAGADPMLQDELRFFTQIAAVGKAEVFADTLNAMRRR